MSYPRTECKRCHRMVAVQVSDPVLGLLCLRCVAPPRPTAAQRRVLVSMARGAALVRIGLFSALLGDRKTVTSSTLAMLVASGWVRRSDENPERFELTGSGRQWGLR